MGPNVRGKAWFTGLFLASILLTGIVRSEDWPWFRGPGRQGISQEKEVPTQWSPTSNILWKTPIPGEGWSSPILFEDRVFVTTALEDGSSLHMLCLDRRSGKVVWDKEIIRQKAGHRQPNNSYATPTPATDGTRVYVPACDGRVLAVSMDGEIQWTNSDFNYYYSEHGLAVSPVLYEDLVIVPFDWSSPPPDTKIGWQVPWDKAVILAVDKNTGKTRWKGSRGSSRIAHVTPQIAKVDGQDQLVSGAGNVIQGHDLKTGELLWTVDSPGEGVVPSIVIGEGLVFTASGFGESRVCAVRLGGHGNVTKTHTVWESKDDVPKMSSMLYASSRLYLATETGVAKCFKAATGEVLWRERLGPKFSASPVWADGRIYFLAENGKMTVVEDGPAFKVVAQNDLGEKCCASPAISQGNLFIRTEKALYCIGK
jgi:outer membrane protein assembly factor BamB